MLRKLSVNEFDALYEIMEQSFPPDERRPYGEQKALLSRPDYTVYASGQPVQAFLAVWSFDDFAFLEHFAVHPSARNTGLGSKLLGELISMLDKPLCLEVEPPEDELTCRRVRFYEKNGLFLNQFPYVQPPISQGKRPVPLLLMTSERAVSQEEFEAHQSQIYAKVYGVGRQPHEKRKD